MGSYFYLQSSSSSSAHLLISFERILTNGDIILGKFESHFHSNNSPGIEVVTSYQ